MAYCWDTSALIEGWTRHYNPQVFPTLWANIEGLVGAGEIVAPIQVLEELSRQDDDVHAWAKARSAMFVPLEADVQTALSEVLSHVQEFANAGSTKNMADPFVVAVARAKGLSVVTYENDDRGRRPPKIPEVCRLAGVEWRTMLQFIREQGWSF